MALQQEASEVARELRIEETLGRAGRVERVGSSVTGLMVWRDLDFVVDAPGCTTAVAFTTMMPLLVRSLAVRYENDRTERRHYFVLRVPWHGRTEWKIDVSVFVAGVPPEVEAFQRELGAMLTDELRLVILRLKEAWQHDPAYPDVVGGYELCDAVMRHGVRTLGDLEAYLRRRSLPLLTPV